MRRLLRKFTKLKQPFQRRERGANLNDELSDRGCKVGHHQRVGDCEGAFLSRAIGARRDELECGDASEDHSQLGAHVVDEALPSTLEEVEHHILSGELRLAHPKEIE